MTQQHDSRIPRVTTLAVYGRAKQYIDIELGPACEDCWAQGGSLEMHHNTYRGPYAGTDYEQDIHGNEAPDALALLCRRCHHERHVGPGGCYRPDHGYVGEYADKYGYCDFCADPEEAAGQRDWFEHQMSED